MGVALPPTGYQPIGPGAAGPVLGSPVPGGVGPGGVGPGSVGPGSVGSAGDEPFAVPSGALAPETDLTGQWRAAVAEEVTRRAFPLPAFDDSAWERVEVPHHWQDVPAFSACTGPLLYRRPFSVPAPEGDERAWLVFQGIHYQGDIWLDGSYLGDTEGWFFPHEFEVTDRLAAAPEHLLAVEVGCPVGPGSGRGLLGIWDDPAWATPGASPGGISGGVRLVRTGPVKVVSMRVACREARAAKAVVELSVELDSSIAGLADVQITARRVPGRGSPLASASTTPSSTTHTGAAGAKTGSASVVAQMLVSHSLAVGPNRSRWRLEVPQPQLWWPLGMGEQPFYELELEVGMAGERSDGRCVRTGLREVRMRDMRWTVNGERLFLMGADLLPPVPGTASSPGGARAHGLAEATGAQIVAQLEQAASAGLNMVRPRAQVAAPALYEYADRMGMLVWQDLPLHGRFRGGRRQAVSQAQRLTERLGHHPSVIAWCAHDYPHTPGTAKRVLVAWQGLVLDRAVRRSFERCDPSRPALASAGPFPGTGWARPGPAGGWPLKRPHGIPASGALWPALFRFVQPVPVTPTGAHVMRSQVEALRRAQWRPVGGFVLEDLPVAPAKLGALRAACAPLIVTATWPGHPLVPGGEVTFDIYVVAAPGHGLDGGRVEAQVSWSGGGRRWVYEGDARPGTTFVGRGTFAAPRTASEQVELVLALVSPSGQRLASNYYTSAVTAL